MHPTQQKLLDLAKKIKINSRNPRIIARLIDIEFPQNVIHHLEQLKKKGFISISKAGEIKVEKYESGFSGGLVKLPIFGSANCGPATLRAEQNLQGYLGVSSEKVKGKRKEGLFIVIADGDSLNAAKDIEGGPISSGDYVVIDGDNISPHDGQYVLSIIDGMANLKKFYKDKKNKQIRLESESKMETKPIHIREEDLEDYMINGVVVGVIKKSKSK
jgi:repressor LexA